MINGIARDIYMFMVRVWTAQRVSDYKNLSKDSIHTWSDIDVLSGMDIDIMKIIGHTSPAILRKYIKAENLTVVEKITDKYDYFD